MKRALPREIGRGGSGLDPRGLPWVGEVVVDEVDALRDLAERTVGRLVVTVVVAAILGLILWPLGWSPAFHLGPWPWALTVPAVVAAAAVEVMLAALARRADDEKETALKAAARSAGREARADALADYLVQALESRRGAAAGPAPEGPWKAEIDAARDPLSAAVSHLAALAPRGGEALAAAFDALPGPPAPPRASTADALAALWAWTLPFGLVADLGPWVAIVAPAVALAVFALPAATRQFKSPFRR